METKVESLGYVIAGAKDLDAWQRYAEQVLGVQCRRDGDSLLLRYDSDAWRICITGTGEDDITCAGFQVASKSDLEKISKRLDSLGFEASPSSDAECKARGVELMAACHDPDGLRVELYVGDRSVDTPFESPRQVAGFVTGDQGMGHMVLMVSDLDKAEAFYREGLGFLLSDHIYLGPKDKPMALTFLHCNPRHHTLALVPGDVKRRLDHVMLQVTDMDDVGLGLDVARSAGVPIRAGLGKHTNDWMTSFYMQTPSGFAVEYGYGGREIDDAAWQPTSYDSGSIWGHKQAG